MVSSVWGKAEEVSRLPSSRTIAVLVEQSEFIPRHRDAVRGNEPSPVEIVRRLFRNARFHHVSACVRQYPAGLLGVIVGGQVHYQFDSRGAGGCFRRLFGRVENIV